jgi:hypothetical protein
MNTVHLEDHESNCDVCKMNDGCEECSTKSNNFTENVLKPLIERRVDLENEIGSIMNQKENGVEELVGLLSSIASVQQLEALVQHLRKGL